MSHAGSCFCGAVTFEVTGAPEVMGYCHSPVVPLVVGRPGQRLHPLEPGNAQDRIRRGDIATFQKTPFSQRRYCRLCGGHLMNNHPTITLVDIYAANLPTLPFKPDVHVNYAEPVLPMRDGLPKLKDFPAAFGGSGEVIPEAVAA